MLDQVIPALLNVTYSGSMVLSIPHLDTRVCLNKQRFV